MDIAEQVHKLMLRADKARAAAQASYNAIGDSANDAWESVLTRDFQAGARAADAVRAARASYQAAVAAAADAEAAASEATAIIVQENLQDKAPDFRASVARKEAAQARRICKDAAAQLNAVCDYAQFVFKRDNGHIQAFVEKARVEGVAPEFWGRPLPA